MLFRSLDRVSVRWVDVAVWSGYFVGVWNGVLVGLGYLSLDLGTMMDVFFGLEINLCPYPIPVVLV